MDLRTVIAVVAFTAVGAAALAARNRIVDEEDGYWRRLFLLFRGQREQYNAVGWRAFILGRVLMLTAFILLGVLIIVAVRAA